MQGLEWEEIESAGCVVLRLRGNIAMYNSRDLEQRLDELALEERRHVALNLKDVSYFDSRGMGLFLDAFKKFEERRTRFCLVSIPPARVQHFKISGLLGVIQVYRTEEAALADLGGDL